MRKTFHIFLRYRNTYFLFSSDIVSSAFSRWHLCSLAIALYKTINSSARTTHVMCCLRQSTVTMTNPLLRLTVTLLSALETQNLVQGLLRSALICGALPHTERTVAGDCTNSKSVDKLFQA